MKRYTILWLSFLAGLTSALYAQAPELPEKNLTGEPVYKADALPGNNWQLHRLEYDKTDFSLAGESLFIATEAGADTQLGWSQEAENGFDPDNQGYTVEIKAKIKESNSAHSFILETATAGNKGFRLGIGKEGLTDATDNTLAPVVLNEESNDEDFHTFRYAVTNDGDIHIYRDHIFLQTIGSKEYTLNNIFPGGNAESGEIGIWDLEDPGDARINTDMQHVYSGKYSFYFRNNWWRSFSSGGILVKPGTTYTLSFWVKQIGGDESQMQNIEIKIDDQIIYTDRITYPAYSSFRKIEKTFITPPSAKFLYLNFPLTFLDGWDRLCTFIVDEITLVEENTFEPPFLFFGKPANREHVSAEIAYVTYDLSGAYAPKTYEASELEKLIEEAKNTWQSTPAGYNTNEAPPYAKDRLQEVIESAEEVAANSEATEEEIDNICLRLTQAMLIFDKCIITDPSIELISIAFSSPASSMYAGTEMETVLSGKLTGGTDADLSIAKIRYSSSNETVAKVNETGKITALASGQAKIKAEVQLNSIVLEEELEIEVAQLESIEILPYLNTVEAGEATGTQLILKMSDGTVYPGTDASIAYTSLDETIAMVNSYGSIIGIFKGEVVIKATATLNGIIQSDETTVTVIELEAIEVTPLPVTPLQAGDIVQVQVTGTFSDGSTMDMTNLSTLYTPDDKEYIRVNDQGQVQAFSNGSTTLNVFTRRGAISLAKSYAVEIGGGTDIKEISSPGFSVYPNPSTGIIFFENETKESMRVEICDLTGKKVVDLSTTDNRINISGLPRGIYIIRFNRQYTGKVVKE